MRDVERILIVMEENKKPLQAKTIAKFIYDRFNGYKLSRYTVRDILWDKNGLKNLVIYDKEDYAYSLQSNIETLKKVATDDDFPFNVKIKKFKKVRNDNNIINHSIEGDKVTISHCVEKEDIDKIIIGITKTEIEVGSNYKKIFNRIKGNISKAIYDDE